MSGIAPTRLASDQGSATIVAALITMSLLALTWLIVQLGTAATTRHRTEGAADLAALAAATYAPAGPEAACGKAEQIVRRMGGDLASCRLQGWDAVVEVHARRAVDPFGDAYGRARAGPTSR